MIRSGETAAGGMSTVPAEDGGETGGRQARPQPSLISAVGSGGSDIAGTHRKRKPTDEHKGESSDGENDEEATMSFAANAAKRRKRAKGFTEEKDYIGFDDEDEEEGSSEEEDDEGDSDDDGASVSSGSDSDSEEEEDSDSDDESSSDGDADGT